MIHPTGPTNGPPRDPSEGPPYEHPLEGPKKFGPPAEDPYNNER